MSTARRVWPPGFCSMVPVRLGFYLSERLGKCVKTNQRNFADEIAALESHQRAQRHIVIGADNHVWG